MIFGDNICYGNKTQEVKYFAICDMEFLKKIISSNSEMTIVAEGGTLLVRGNPHETTL